MEVETLRWQRLFGATFAFSSVIVPFSKDRLS
jgi:hypothetical protein